MLCSLRFASPRLCFFASPLAARKEKNSPNQSIFQNVTHVFNPFVTTMDKHKIIISREITQKIDNPPAAVQIQKLKKKMQRGRQSLEKMECRMSIL
jgi:hypothetical protein